MDCEQVVKTFHKINLRKDFMPEKFLAACVPEDVKLRLKLAAAGQGVTVQDFIGQLVQNYYTKADDSSSVTLLGVRDQVTI